MSVHWGVEWHEKNRVDGDQRAIMWADGKPLTFRTRQAARDYIAKTFGYIRWRDDLRREPHGWRVPQAVRIKIYVEKV